MTNTIENTLNKTINGELIMNNVLTKEEYLEAIQTFKALFNDKELRKKKKIERHTYTVGNIEKSYVTCDIKPSLYQLRHFIFYNMLRHKDITNMVHSTESEKYIEEIARFNVLNKTNYFLKDIQKGFPNLSMEKIEEIINKNLEK